MAVLSVNTRWVDRIHWNLFQEYKFPNVTLIVVSFLDMADSYFATFESSPKEMDGDVIRVMVPKTEIICVVHFKSDEQLKKQIGFVATANA
jgi:hypothetical protein